MKKLFLFLFVLSICYGQLRTLNGSSVNSQRMRWDTTGTPNIFKITTSDAGIHTVWFPYQRFALVGGSGSVGNADSLGSLPASSYFRKSDTVNFKGGLLKNADSTSQRNFSDIKYPILANSNTFTGTPQIFSMVYADSFRSKTPSLPIIFNDTTFVNGILRVRPMNWAINQSGGIRIGARDDTSRFNYDLLVKSNGAGQSRFSLGSYSSGVGKTDAFTMNNTGYFAFGDTVGVSDLFFVRFNAPASASYRENPLKFSISDDANSFGFIGNATAVNSKYAPIYGGYQGTDSTFIAQAIYGFIPSTFDSSNNASMITLRGYRTTSAADPMSGTITAIQNRDILDIRSGSTRIATFGASGNITFGTSTTNSTTRFTLVNNATNPYISTYYNSRSQLGSYLDSSFNFKANKIITDTLIADNGNVVVNDSAKFTGKVGIGMTPEGAQFVIKSINGGALRLYGTTSTNYWQVGTSFDYTDVDLFWLHGGTERFRWDALGNHMLGLTPANVATTARMGIRNNAVNPRILSLFNSTNTLGLSVDSSFNLTSIATLQGTTGKFTNLTDNYLPYHVSDASGLANSVIQTNGSQIGIGTTANASYMLSVGGHLMLTNGANRALTVGSASNWGVVIRTVSDDTYFDDAGATNFLKFNYNGSNEFLTIAVPATITGALTASSTISVAGTLFPSTTGTRDLGTYLLEWDSLFVGDIKSSGNAFRAGNDSTTGKGTYGDTIRSGNYTTYSYFIPGGALVQSSDSTLKEKILPFTANLANFKLVQPRTYNFKKQTFIIPFDEKSVPDSIEVQIDSATVRKVSNKSTKDAIRAEHVTKNNLVADRLASANHSGFLAQEFNQKLFGKNSNEIRQEDVINALWLKVQELEKRIETLEKK